MADIKEKSKIGMDYVEEITKKELVFEVIAIKKNIGYVSDFRGNGLFEVNIETGESKYLGLFPNEEILKGRLHCHAEWIDDKIYFIPSAGKNISIYHLDSKEFETIEIPPASKKQHIGYMSKLKFIKAIQYKGFLWIVPATYPGIIKFNLKTYELKIINNWASLDDKYKIRRAVCHRDNIIYAASGNNNNVLVFDMDLEKGRLVKIGNSNHGIMHMSAIGDEFIMAPLAEGPVIRWNPITGCVEEFNDYPMGFSFGKIVFHYIYEYKTDIIFIPGHASHGIRLSDNQLKIEKEIAWKEAATSKTEFVFETENRIYLREVKSDLSNRFFFINKKDNTITEFGFYISNFEERQKEVVKLATKNHEMMRESSFFRIRDFINAIF